VLAQQPYTVKLDANGAGTIRIQNDNPMVVVVMRQVYVVCNPKKPGATADILDASFGVTTSYNAGTGDTAKGDPPLYLPRGYFCDVVFANGPPLGQGIAITYYEEMSA
jgi:hypothetical protein